MIGRAKRGPCRALQDEKARRKEWSAVAARAAAFSVLTYKSGLISG
jgi:hypothetical protein